ncbi:hypothetical protein SAMN05192542_11534 [Paraburkholderia caballeronis]|uniref:Uncharacterized protein n=1 Tax=Paraburkholderia caballeronis TaxID=416943 RepID=A0A1H7TGA5_9BURK|nr:hypothetical protein C7403_11634 [Paraburkholderia caballeronis]PXW95632.1 hypothetical protein C7407_11634 [Paraburkholderia caballeronis]RAJ91978.1 hypothetical protein C7409_11634 [Paraburkholderia caballeronis]SEL83605.1 hypothetical protein SAMN05192542_11534 [Paraburkholderia caballeronis]
MQREAGALPEPEDEGLQREIVSPLRKAFGQFVNRELRFAVMLDEERTGDDGDRQARVRKLVERFAEAIAYARALDRCDGDHASLASCLARLSGELRSCLSDAETVYHGSIRCSTEFIPPHFMPMAGRSCGSRPRWGRMRRNACKWARLAQLGIFCRVAVFAR